MTESASAERFGNSRDTPYQLAAFLTAFFALWTLRATWLYQIDEQFSSPLARAAYSSVVKATLWLLPAAVYQHRIEGSIQRLFSLTPMPDRQNWLRCAVTTVAFLIAVFSVEILTAQKTLASAKLFDPSRDHLEQVAIAVLHYVLSPLIEECFFRGFLLRTMLRFGHHTSAIAINSCLFVFIHWPFWLSHRESWMLFFSQSAGVFLFSLVAGWLYQHSRSVWPPAMAHLLNNVLASALVVRH